MARPALLNDLLNQLAGGPTTAGELGARLGVSQPTVSRLLAQAGNRVVRVGRGRATRYASTHTAFGVGDRIPVYTVAENGVVSQIALLRPLNGGGYYLEGERRSWWALGEAGTGLFESLPYFLEDGRPQGFLGRHEAERLSRQGGWPADPRRWSESQVGAYWIDHGGDLPGNLLLGERALGAYRQAMPSPIKDRNAQYPAMAERVLGGEPVGSSAGGEQPKFTALTSDGHLIVKFSPRRDSLEGGRWADLLVAEHLAQRTLAQAGIPCAGTDLRVIGDRYYLEVRRFDRVGEHGRRPSLSMAAIDAEYVGLGEDWISVAERLLGQGRLDAQSRRTVIWAATFGQWIGNTDMHLHNLSLAPGADGFTLLPLYDMTAMLFAPRRGEIVDRRPGVPIRVLDNVELWEETGQAARQFWEAVATDARVSEDFRATAQGCAAEVAQAIDSPSPPPAGPPSSRGQST